LPYRQHRALRKQNRLEAQAPLANQRPQKQYARSWTQRAFEIYLLVKSSNRMLASGVASNALDLGAVDTEVVQRTVGHAAEFANGLTILAPVIEGACYVHDDPLS
jgi:hypothetical protein